MVNGIGEQKVMASVHSEWRLEWGWGSRIYAEAGERAESVALQLANESLPHEKEAPSDPYKLQ